MDTTTDARTWVRIGATQGAKWGFLLALAYTVWVAFFEISTVLHLLPAHIAAWVTNSPPPVYTPELYFEHIQRELGYTPIIIGIGSVVGGIPALLIGAGSGGALGWLFSRPQIAPSPQYRLLVSIGIALLVAFSVNALVVELWYSVSTLLFAAIPTLVYMGVCLWLSYQIPRLVERAHAKEIPITPSPVSPR